MPQMLANLNCRLKLIILYRILMLDKSISDHNCGLAVQKEVDVILYHVMVSICVNFFEALAEKGKKKGKKENLTRKSVQV